LPFLPDMPVTAYIELSLRRVANTAIRHRCHQIGTDGSQKLVQRLVNPLRERMEAGHPPGLLALGVASWLAYVLSGAERFGARWSPDDPLASRVIRIGEQTGEFAALSEALLGFEAVFGPDLAGSPASPAVAAHLRGLLSPEPRRYLAELVGV
jgi:fructuronate reductase